MIRDFNIQNEHVNLLVTIDRKYIEPLVVMLQSYHSAHRHVKTDVYIAHSSLDENDFVYIRERMDDTDICIHNIEIREHYFSVIPILERIPEESFYRLLAFLYLPEGVERCLYLDPDIFINQSILPLYMQDMQEYYIAAAGHLHGFREWFNKRRLGVKKNERYLNSGVMLMNLKTIRQDFTLEKILNCLEENAQRLILGDQDMANLLFGQNALVIDECVYNLDERAYRYHSNRNQLNIATVRKKTAVIHYNGKYKPWLDGYKGDLDCFYPKPEILGDAPKGLVGKQIKSACKIMKPNRQQAVLLFGGVFFVFLCLLSYLFWGKELLKLVADPTIFREWLQRFGVFDELIFILIRAAQTVIKFVPAEPLEIASGYAWGAIPGMLYCVIGNMLGTLAILGLTRFFGQKIIHILLPKKDLKLVKLLETDEKIYALLFFLYLIPGSPKDGFTYFVGLLPVKIIPFMVITGIARMPSVLSSTLCGETMAEQQYWISACIIVITVLLAVLGGLLYRKFVIMKEKETAKEKVIA